jgi:hypothetical protein
MVFCYGYYQIPIAEQQREKLLSWLDLWDFFLAQQYGDGTRECTSNLPECLGDLLYRICFIYLNNSIVFSGNSFDDTHRQIANGVPTTAGKCLASAHCLKGGSNTSQRTR